jgi:hypothetical protein
MNPTFLCIGGQRCGTTWLHKMLDALAHVHVCKSKETDYFYANILRQDLAEYERNFDPPPNQPACAVRGELSPNYCMLKRPSIELIHNLYPQLRVLLILRDPVQRTLSQTWLDLRYMNGKTRTELLSVGEYLRHFERQRTKRRNDYVRIIQDWRAVVGREQLQVELYDDLRDDPAAFLRRVLRFLGGDDRVALPADVLRVKVFESAKSVVPPMVRWYLAKEYREQMRQLNDLLEGRVTHWLRAMDKTLAEAPPSWQVVRSLNKFVLSVPEKIAYASYDARRDLRLSARGRQVLRQPPPQPATAAGPRKPLRTGLHRDATSVSTA